MATSPIYSWPEPDNTDLVKNGALAIRTLGNAIDTTMGTMVAKTVVDAKGDLIAGTAADTVNRLAVGANGESLVADSSTATGLRWQGDYAAGKNKFINSDMAIAQRGASPVTVSAGARFFSPDRTFGQLNGAGAFTVEQVVDAPAAANASQYSLKAVVTTADTSIAANDQYWLGQIIEAQNFASFQFGTASAQTVTISFWVKSSITGTFGIDIRNSAADRSYVSTYTISAANTWEKKTVTIAGDTSGTWLKDTGVGARIEWALSAGTDFQTGSANSWTASNDMTTSSQTNWMATLSNSFQITAIQIEAGSVATAFQTATGSIQQELAACQRYYWRAGGDSNFQPYGVGAGQTTTAAQFSVQNPVPMRVAPTSIDFSTLAVTDTILAFSISALGFGNAGKYASTINVTTSGLTLYRPYILVSNNSTSGFFGLSAEL